MLPRLPQGAARALQAALASRGERRGDGADRRGRVRHCRAAGDGPGGRGYRVLTAANGWQGLQRLAEGPLPDLVIPDYMTPILDGAEMLRAMRETQLQRDIPCIVISSVPEETVRGRIENHAAYVCKPFQLAFMIQLVADVLAGFQPES